VDELLQLLGHLTPGELLVDPRSTPSAVYLGLLAFFLIVGVGGTLASVLSSRLARGNRIHQRLLDVYGQWAAWLGFAGVVIVGLRYANVSLLSKRIWTILDLLAIAAVAIHFIVYWVRKYPAEIAAYRDEERKRRYLPGTRRRRR